MAAIIPMTTARKNKRAFLFMICLLRVVVDDGANV
jgi:hypothetical protein